MSSDEVRLTRMIRHDAVRELTAQYAFALDDRSWSGLSALFEENAILDTAVGVVEGAAAIVDWYRDYMESAMPGWSGSHFITNHRFIGTDPADELAAECYFFYTFRGRTESIVGWGRYFLVARFADDRAKFSRLKIEVKSQSDVREGWTL